MLCGGFGPAFETLDLDTRMLSLTVGFYQVRFAGIYCLIACGFPEPFARRTETEARDAFGKKWLDFGDKECLMQEKRQQTRVVIHNLALIACTEPCSLSLVDAYIRFHYRKLSRCGGKLRAGCNAGE